MQHRLLSDRLTVLINNMGAEICSIKNEKGLEYIWTGDKTIWGRHAPVLFPIVGKLKDDSFIFKGKEYSLGQHGFARDMAFISTKINNYSCTFELVSTAETKKVFPFDFNFQISYELRENKLVCCYKIKNTSDEPILFSVGAHPGFNCPLTDDEKFEDYYLEFENDFFIQTTLMDGLRGDRKNLHIKDCKLFLSDTLFNEDALVFENNQINKIKLCSSKSSNHVTLVFKEWPYFGIWAKKGTTKFICLEPWYGVADDSLTKPPLDKKAGIIKLGPTDEFNCSFSIEIN